MCAGRKGQFGSSIASQYVGLSQAFQEAAASGQSTQHQLQVLRSARLESVPEDDLTSCSPQWRLACMAAVIPGAVQYLHDLLVHPGRGLLPDQVQVRNAPVHAIYVWQPELTLLLCGIHKGIIRSNL